MRGILPPHLLKYHLKNNIMAFLTKKETALITSINTDNQLSLSERQNVIDCIKNNARLRSDGFRKNIKVALHVIANHKNEKIASNYVK